jgi:hypothetical protein
MQLGSSRQRLCSSSHKEHRPHAFSLHKRCKRYTSRTNASLAMDGAVPEDKAEEVGLSVSPTTLFYCLAGIAAS